MPSDFALATLKGAVLFQLRALAMQNASPLRKLRRCPAWLRGALSFCVCLSLLQIPVPVLHHHDQFESDQVLVRHLVRDHCREVYSTLVALEPVFSLGPHEESELHWHFVLPSDLGQEKLPEEDASRPTAGLLASEFHLSPPLKFAVDWIVKCMGAACVPAFGSQVIIPVRPPQSRYPAPCYGVQLCTLLCVMRC